VTRAESWVGLIRAIGPRTHRRMSMEDLRSACIGAGMREVRTLLATGNLLATSEAGEQELKARLGAILAGFGLDNAVFLRRPRELEAVLAGNPFRDAAEARPDHLLVLFLDRRPDPEATARLSRYAGPERTALRGREVFIDYAAGVGRSKLTAAVLERHIGQPGTARNWNTLGKLFAASAAVF
jgi:uncharacterized protein (DUF1697 family)